MKCDLHAEAPVLRIRGNSPEVACRVLFAADPLSSALRSEEPNVPMHESALKSPGFTIRPAVDRDFEEWKPLWDGYNAFYGRHGPTALPIEVTRATWSRFHDANVPMGALVAEGGGRLVGLAHYILHASTNQVAQVCYLQDLFTDPAARGQGIGEALIEAVYERARALGCRRVYWQTHETNAIARRLYDQVAERSGFIVYRKDV